MSEAATRIQVANNLKQIGWAFHNYHDAHGRFPPAAKFSKDGQPLLSWRVLILPYLDEDSLYREFHLDEPWDSPHNRELLARMPKVYRSLGDFEALTDSTFFQVFVGKETAFVGTEGIKLKDITDRPSNTILVMEGGEPVLWSKPEEIPFNPTRPLPKLGGINP